MVATYIAGIDPGLDGAIALLGPTLIVWPMPTLKIKVGGKIRRQIDNAQLGRWFDMQASSISLAIIENVHAMPKQGVSSSFSFGRSFGAVEQALASSAIAVQYAEPSVWKRAMGLTGDKDMSRRLASRLLPAHAHLWPLKGDDGKAEATLLAIYGSKTR